MPFFVCFCFVFVFLNTCSVEVIARYSEPCRSVTPSADRKEKQEVVGVSCSTLYWYLLVACLLLARWAAEMLKMEFLFSSSVFRFVAYRCRTSTSTNFILETPHASDLVASNGMKVRHMISSHIVCVCVHLFFCHLSQMTWTMPFHIPDATCAATLQDYFERSPTDPSCSANSEPITVPACGTANLHTEHWCTVQRVERGLKETNKKKNCHAALYTQHSRHMHYLHSVFITPPCGHSCDCTDETAARPETWVCDLLPPSLPEPYGASETENGNVVRAKGELTTEGLSPGGGDVSS